jgi:hypothetical protein
MPIQRFERLFASGIYFLTGISAAHFFCVGLTNGIASGYRYPVQQKLLISGAAGDDYGVYSPAVAQAGSQLKKHPHYTHYPPAVPALPVNQPICSLGGPRQSPKTGGWSRFSRRHILPVNAWGGVSTSREK